LDEIAEAERQVVHGEHPSRPFVLLAQQSQFDETRAPVTTWLSSSLKSSVGVICLNLLS
jgi:phytoene dehydrogenase-like protein